LRAYAITKARHKVRKSAAQVWIEADVTELPMPDESSGKNCQKFTQAGEGIPSQKDAFPRLTPAAGPLL
jgi:hypothetical protein